MIEMSFEKRQERACRVEAERDSVVNDVLGEIDATLVSARRPLGGWDAQYIVEIGSHKFCLTDCATIPLDKLAGSIRQQVAEKRRALY